MLKIVHISNINRPHSNIFHLVNARKIQHNFLCRFKVQQPVTRFWKTSCKNVMKTSFEDILQTCLDNLLKTSWKTKHCYAKDFFKRSSWVKKWETKRNCINLKKTHIAIYCVKNKNLFVQYSVLCLLQTYNLKSLSSHKEI